MVRVEIYFYSCHTALFQLINKANVYTDKAWMLSKAEDGNCSIVDGSNVNIIRACSEKKYNEKPKAPICQFGICQFCVIIIFVNNLYNS